MFCTKCGKELYEGDRFCAHCGAAVRESKRARYDDVVFNPPFKIEAEKRTEEILKSTEKPEPAEKKREKVEFDWNLEGFPSAQPRKTEAVDFNWDSVLEKRKNSRSIDVEKIETPPEAERKEAIIPEIVRLDAQIRQEAEGEPDGSIEELEQELFGNLNDSDDNKERFYTYNQKLDAFQELLKKEKEKLQNMENSYSPEKTGREPEIPEKEEKVSAEFVGVAVPPMTMTVDLSESGSVKELQQEKPEKKEPEEDEMSSPSKIRLRYSDIFPRDLVDDDSTGGDASSEEVKKVNTEKTAADNGNKAYYDIDEDDDEPEKKHTFAKVVIAILIILIVIEGGLLAVKFIAPESKISLWTNDAMIKVIDLFSGKDGDEPEGDPSDGTGTEEDVYMSGLVNEASGDMKTIGEAVYNPNLKYSLLKNYSFEEISSAEEFVDADWFEDQSGNAATYGQKLTEALIDYYDGWQSSNEDKSLVGINKLEIGEIRTGQDAFYALCRLTYAGEDGNDVIKYQTACLKVSEKAMIINEIKEENL